MRAKRITVLVVEDDQGLQRQLKWALDEFDVRCVATRDEAIAAVRRQEPAVVLQDLGLPPDPNGVEEGFATITEIQRLAPNTKVIVITGREGREHALRAIGLGAFDFCQKPVDVQVLTMLVDRALRIRDLESEIDRTREAKTPATIDGVIAMSEPMLKACRMIKRLAGTPATVLLLGESGTGKELLARALHELSPRARGAWVAINCAAIPESLLESELFGHERGAFTGAVKQSVGKFESAHGGTLFLDEIGDMPHALQAKLLRFLQERVVERLGGRELIAVDVRIVAATNCDLRAAIEQRLFREDLYYRINEVSVTVPPLRERGSDAVLIASHLLQRACERNGKPRMLLGADAIQAIETYGWPGNVRELVNRVNGAAIMVEGRWVTAADLGLDSSAPPAGELPSLRTVRQRAEAEAVQRALAVTGGNLSKAAELLGVTRPTLYDLIERTSNLPPEE